MSTDLTPASAVQTTKPAAALELSGIAKRFGGNDVLRHVDMSVTPSSVHLLIGPNGAGKTTLFNIITGFTSSDAGTVTLFGEDITGVTARKLSRRGVARTFQNLLLFDSLTVLENMLVPLHARMSGSLVRAMLGLVGKEERREHERAVEWLERFDLLRYAGVRPSELSYGDRRLIEVVRALAAEPKVLLLDEPAAGLGLEARARLARVLSELKGTDLTMVLVEHDMRFGMSLADEVTVLDAGARIAHGTPREVQRDDAVIKAYLGHGRGRNG